MRTGFFIFDDYIIYTVTGNSRLKIGDW